MRDDDHGHVLLGKRADDLQNLAGQLRVEGGGRLVEAEDVRLQRQRPRDGHALLLAAGELVRVEVHFLLQPHLREQLLRVRGDLCVDLLFAGLVVRLLFGQQLAGKHDVLPGRVLREQIEILKHEAEMQPLAADLALFLRVGVRRVEERLAVYRDLPLVGDGQEIEAAQQRRLAAAGRADDGDGLALFQ